MSYIGLGDLAGDGTVNFDDFGLWKDIFNGTTAVPEPNTAFSALLAAMLLAAIRRPLLQKRGR